MKKLITTSISGICYDYIYITKGQQFTHQLLDFFSNFMVKTYYLIKRSKIKQVLSNKKNKILICCTHKPQLE